MSALGKLVVSIALESSQFTKGLSKSEQEAQRFAKNTQGNFSSLDKVTSQVFGSMARAVTGPIAAFVSVSAAIDLVSNSLNFADKINDVSKANEVAVGTVLNLSQALSLNGGEADNAGKLFASLTAKLDEAAGGSESAQAQFKKVGVSLKDLATLDGEALFEKTLAGLMAIEDPIKRNATAMDLLGKSVKGVDIKGLGADLSDNAQNFTDADEKFKAIGEAMDKIDKSSTKLKESIAVSIAPWFAATVDYLDKLISGYATLEKNIRNAHRAQTGDTSSWKATPKITDKPVFGTFNLPAEYQGGAKREVIDTAAESAKNKALSTATSLAKEAARKAEAERKKQNEEILKDIQFNIDFEQSQKEALYQFDKDAAEKQEKIDKELYENKARYIDLIQQQSESAFQEELDRQKEIQDKNMEFWGSVENTAHDVWTKVWLDGSNAFKNIGKTIKSSILDMLYQMTIKKWILNIGTSATGLSASSAFADIGSLGSASGGGNILSNLFSSGNASIVSGIESLGASISNGMGGIRDSIGGFIGANSSAIADGFGYAGSIIALSQGKYLTAAGTAIGTYFGGPLGAAIGGAVGGFLDKAFGIGGPKRFSSNASGSFSNNQYEGTIGVNRRDFGAGGTLGNLNEAFSQSLGALLTGFGLSDSISTASSITKKKRGSASFNASFDGGSASYYAGIGKKGSVEDALKTLIESVLSTTLVQAIQSSKLSSSIKELFDGLTDKTQVSNMINASINLSSASDKLASSFGLTVDQAAQVAVATGNVGDALAQFLTGIATAAGGQSVAQLLVKARTSFIGAMGSDLPNTLKGFDSIIKGIDKSNADGIAQVAKLLSVRAGFEQYVNSIDSLKAGVEGSTFDFRSGTQQQSIMQSRLADLFGELNLSVPKSTAELIALSDSIDYTTENGVNLALAFPNLVNAFKSTKDQVIGLTDSLATLSTDGFATLLDYTRYKGVAANYGTQFAGDYTHNLKNGAIQQNKNGTTTVVGSDGKTNVVDEIKAMRNDLNTAMVAVATSSAQTAKVLRLWNGDGMPDVRVL